MPEHSFVSAFGPRFPVPETTAGLARETGGVNASAAPRRKTAPRRPRLDASAPGESEVCAGHSLGSDAERTCDAGRAITGQRAWETFLECDDPRVCAEVRRGARVLEPHLGCGPWIGVSSARVVEGDPEHTAAMAAAALRTLVRRHEIAAASTCWINLHQGAQAADLFPAIAGAVGRPRPRGEDVYSWTKEAVYRTGTRLVVLAGFDRVLRGRGVATLTDSGLEYLIKDQQTEYVLLGDGLCEKLVKRNKYLGIYLTRLGIGELLAQQAGRTVPR